MTIEKRAMIRSIYGHVISKAVAKRRCSYEPLVTPAQKLKKQLQHFNQCWPAIRHNVPFYNELAVRNNLPDSFRSWEEIIDLFPVVNRALAQKNILHMIDQSKKPQCFRITGGSTGQPIQMPAWKSEYKVTTPDMWLGRAWYGIKPDDRLFMIWGHSHLLGSGWQGLLNRRVRECKDWLLGYYCFSAYSIDPNSMKTAAEAMVRFAPQYMIGYSVALDAFARSNLDRTQDLRALKLKAVIGAAEGFPAGDSVDLIGGLTGAPVAMEYGSVETGLIAHTYPEDEGYRVFWQTYFVEATEGNQDAGKIVRVTSLYPRSFPLIRYELGDEIIRDAEDLSIGVQHFKRVIGRCNDYLMLSNGIRVHSELISHVVRSCPDIMGFQAIQTGSCIRLYVISSGELSPEVVKGIRYRLDKIHPQLTHIPIERVSRLRQTVAGKTPIVIREAR